ncbi:MAG: NusG domain II-containing protein [Elusimicrobiota bacterium]|nr:NusG domain II-containing protein [Elusimicrobiota bacterium]
MLTRNDRILIFVLVAIASFYFVRLFFVSNEGREALVKVGSNPSQKVSLEINKRINVEGEKGRVVIEVKEGRVRVVESSCFQKICVNTGWINKPGQNIVCLPNKVLVTIEGKKSPTMDAVSY